MSPLTGLYPGLVTNLVDPDRLGRIEVTLPGLGHAGDDVRMWATLLTPYADDNQGIEVLPEVGTQVVIGFEGGTSHRAYIVGSCWNGKESMPVDATKTNNRRVWRSRAGSVLEFDDTPGAAKLTLKTASGHTLVLDDGTMQVALQHASGFGVTLDAGGSVNVTANASVTVTAAAVTVNAPTATFSGLISCQGITTPSVVSASYTPGAGNVW